MSHTQPIPSPTFGYIRLFDMRKALLAYQEMTGLDLLAHPLAGKLAACKSPAAIVHLLSQLNQPRNHDEMLSKWLDPTVKVLCAFSAALEEGGVSVAFSPARVIFTALGFLLLAAKHVQAGQVFLVDIFERIESFFRRLEIYTNVPATAEMMDTITQIFVEMLYLLGIATKVTDDGRIKEYVQKLFGRSDLDDALKRLDQLTHRQARMAEILNATNTVDKGVKGVADDVLGVDGRATRVDKILATVDNRIAGVDNWEIAIGDRVKEVDDKGAIMIGQGNKAKELTQQIVNDVDHVKQNRLREWLSPPDPSTNHNIARGTHHKGTAAWFLKGSFFREWKTTGSLLWIHGKPGAGKSVLCSTVIEDIAAMCKAGKASMAYFYFDFLNPNKQHLQELIPSLLTQLSASSPPRCDILLGLYQAHDSGKTQPSDLALVNCLKQMFSLPDRRPIYLVMDALDECTDTSGIPSPRERVLQLVKELVELPNSKLHICVTSRPAIDIRHVLGPLTSFQLSLHDQSGQKQDIVDCVKSVVYSDSIMKGWKTEDKDLVIETLSERAEGMFRLVFCQLEVLRHCPPSDIRRTLEELPNSIDKTYERVLERITKHKRNYTHRLLQCLAVAVRPLRVEELAEVLAIDFDDPEEIPKLKPSWQCENAEQGLLSSCSSLITIVGVGDSRVVQFAHFSVKEFLTSPRLAASSRDVSRYYIAREPAHRTLGQACFGVLLRSNDPLEDPIRKTSPLARYAAENWVTHAQFENVSSNLRKPMEYLFDPDKSYFAAWLKLHDIDTPPRPDSTFFVFCPSYKSDAAPLYYAALCGFYDLTERLIDKYPHQVNAHGGYYLTPLVAALAEEHFDIAELLLRHGAWTTVNVPGHEERIPLHSAAYYGQIDVVRFLLDHKADVNSRDNFGGTALHNTGAICDYRKGPNIPQNLANIAQLLLERGADVNARNNMGWTPLHIAIYGGNMTVARVLLEHGADVDEEGNERKTPFQVAVEQKQNEIIELLSKYGAKTSR